MFTYAVIELIKRTNEVRTIGIDFTSVEEAKKAAEGKWQKIDHESADAPFAFVVLEMGTKFLGGSSRIAFVPPPPPKKPALNWVGGE